jgi:putative Mg2+ transporter-C (MgtC) family protein
VSTLDYILRLAVATGVGLAIGLNRDLKGKPIGMRTLALVSLGTAIVCLAAMNLGSVASSPDAVSRVLQGIIQGVLTGIGFVGAGVILRDRQAQTVHGLTTAATVWVTAALGIASALAAWTVVLAGTALVMFILVLLRWFEDQVEPFDKKP